MTFHMELDCTNAAFGDDDQSRLSEISRILRMTTFQLDDGRAFVPLYDANGNLVGRAELKR